MVILKIISVFELIVFCKVFYGKWERLVTTTGGRMFGDIEIEASKGIIMKTASGVKWKVTINEAGQLITTKIT